jgi:hypothetical protein
MKRQSTVAAQTTPGYTSAAEVAGLFVFNGSLSTRWNIDRILSCDFGHPVTGHLMAPIIKYLDRRGTEAGVRNHGRRRFGRCHGFPGAEMANHE